MQIRPRSRGVALMAVMAVMVGGCRAPDRAGGSATLPRLRLTVADPLDAPPAEVGAWTQAVGSASHGSIGFTLHSKWARGHTDMEIRAIRAVATGRVDMAFVGARAFDEVGDNDFQPLLAPLLIDSQTLQARVFGAGIPAQMLRGTASVGVTGLAVLPGPLRRMLGVHHAFRSPADFHGATVGIQEGKVADWTIRTLGGTPRPLPSDASVAGVDGYEQQLLSIYQGQYQRSASFVTGNLTLWPKPYVVIINPRVLASLNDAQRQALTDAASTALPAAEQAAANEDQTGLTGICGTSLHFVESSPSEINRLRQTVQSVYSHIDANGDNRSLIARIRDLKNSLGDHPAVPTCAPATPSPSPTANRASVLNGTYRTVLSRDEAHCFPAGERNHRELVFDVTFKDGNASLLERFNRPTAKPMPALPAGDTYRVFHDRLDFPGDRTTLTWSLKGNRLILADPVITDPLAPHCLGRELWTTHPWIRLR